MALSKDERDRILQLVEIGQLRATEAGQLMDTLEDELSRISKPVRNSILRIRTTIHDSQQPRKSFMLSVPVSVLKTSLCLVRNLLPQWDPVILDDIFHTIETGATGRLLDLQDLERGERLEVFVE